MVLAKRRLVALVLPLLAALAVATAGLAVMTATADVRAGGPLCVANRCPK